LSDEYILEYSSMELGYYDVLYYFLADIEKKFPLVLGICRRYKMSMDVQRVEFDIENLAREVIEAYIDTNTGDDAVKMVNKKIEKASDFLPSEFSLEDVIYAMWKVLFTLPSELEADESDKMYLVTR